MNLKPGDMIWDRSRPSARRLGLVCDVQRVNRWRIETKVTWLIPPMSPIWWVLLPEQCELVTNPTDEEQAALMRHYLT